MGNQNRFVTCSSRWRCCLQEEFGFGCSLVTRDWSLAIRQFPQNIHHDDFLGALLSLFLAPPLLPPKQNMIPALSKVFKIIWVTWGDSVDTAVNIATICRLIDKQGKLYYLTCEETPTEMVGWTNQRLVGGHQEVTDLKKELESQLRKVRKKMNLERATLGNIWYTVSGFKRYDSLWM